MSNAIVRREIGYREGRWLVLAVALHALLLLIPPAEERRHTMVERAKLAVRLISLVAPPVQELPPPPVPEELKTAPAEQALPMTEVPMIPDAEPLAPFELPGETDPHGPDISASRLIDLRDSVTQRVPLEPSVTTQSLRLGEPRPFEPPGNWQAGIGAQALAPFENVFNGKTVPAEVEVVDRWLAADGSHNVVLETPAGLRLCGRALAWDPSQPLVEHVMRWHVCGGDFARPFKFKPRQPINRDFIDPVAKETTEP